MADFTHNSFLLMLVENIQSLLPQKPPFVMVEALLSCDEHITQTSFKVVAGNVMLSNDQFTEGGLMENMAQTAAAGAGYRAAKENKPVEVGYIGAVKNFEVFELPQLNDELLTEVKIKDQVFDMTIIAATVRRNTTVIAQCEMNIFIGR
jgi:predicted hotdog family 3-hydroxylacyl-ACP dehydratase